MYRREPVAQWVNYPQTRVLIFLESNFGTSRHQSKVSLELITRYAWFF